MIYITGDTHGDYTRFTRKKRECLPFRLTKEDYVIITGDFGLIWSERQMEETAYWCNFFQQLPFTILFVTGNHENYDMLSAYPITTWNGGKVRHIVKDKIILLERGQVFEIEGKKFFTFGGASSHDIQGGILERDDPDYREKQREIEETGLPYRINHISWWAQELPSEEEMEEGRRNLEKVDYKVDYVITHCLSNITQDLLCKTTFTRYGGRLSYGYDSLTSYLEEIEGKMEYEHWFCGHYHVNHLIDSRHTVLYEQVVPLDYYMEGKYAIKRYLNK